MLPEGEYAKYLAELAARIADERAKARETRWRGFIAGALTILAFLGYTSLASLKADLKAVLGAQVSQEVSASVASYFAQNKDRIVGEALKEIQQQVDSRIAFVQFVDIVNELEKRTTGFSNQERDTANALLKEVIATSDLVERPQFKLALEKLLDTYAAADLEAYIDDIDNILGDVATSTEGISITMTIHYGFRVTGKAELEDADVTRFEKYADAAERHKFPEVSTPFRMGLAFRRADQKPTDTTRNLLENARHFSPGEQRTFIESLESYQEIGDGPDSTGKLVRVGRLFTALWSGHAAELAALKTQSEQSPGPDDGTPSGLQDTLREMLSQ